MELFATMKVGFRILPLACLYFCGFTVGACGDSRLVAFIGEGVEKAVAESRGLNSDSGLDESVESRYGWISGLSEFESASLRIGDIEILRLQNVRGALQMTGQGTVDSAIIVLEEHHFSTPGNGAARELRTALARQGWSPVAGIPEHYTWNAEEWRECFDAEHVGTKDLRMSPLSFRDIARMSVVFRCRRADDQKSVSVRLDVSRASTER